jgi:tetratricopeptide (TPR) repeat protein
MIGIVASTLLAITSSLALQVSAAHSLSTPEASHVAQFEQLAAAAAHAREGSRDDAAIQMYQQALALKPDWDEGLWYLGTLLYEKDDYREAREALRRFVALDSKAGYGWALLGVCEFQLHEYTRALDHLQQSLVIGLGDNKQMAVKVYYLTAILLTRSEQFDDSMSLLFSLAASGDATPPLAEPLGLAALRMPFLPAEIPSDRREMVRMAGAAAVALKAQRYAEAERLFSELEAADPDQPGVHFLIGAYLLGARLDDGIKEMKREIEISPSHVPARIRLAEEYLKRQNMDQAIFFAQEATKLAPEDSLAHLALGEALVAKGDMAGGILHLEAARDHSPETVRIHWDLVRAYIAAGREQDATREKSEIERLSNQNAAH